MQKTPRVLNEQFELLALREYSDGDSDASNICRTYGLSHRD